jgi:tetratricopeptide (TPR) repeat protein
MRGDVSFEGKYAKTIPDELQLCILKTLSKNPIDRYQTATELEEALKSIQQNWFRGHKTWGVVAWGAKVRRRLIMHSASIGFTAISMAITGVIVVACVGVAWHWTMTAHSPDAQKGNASELYKYEMSRADALLDSDNYTQAIIYLQRALHQADNFGPSDPRLMDTLQKLKKAYEKNGKMAEAAKIGQQIQRVQNTTYGAMYGNTKDNAQRISTLSAKLLNNPDDKKTAEELAATLNDQSALLLTEANFDGAKEMLDQAVGIEKRLLGVQNPEYARSLSNLAYVYSRQDKKIKAEQLYREALEIRIHALGPQHPLVGRSLRNLADFYWESGRYQEAEPLMSQSLNIFQKAGPAEQANYAWSLNNLALIHAAQKRTEDARRELAEALKIRKMLYGPDGLDVGRTDNNLAQLDQVQHNFHDAEKEYWAALRIYDKQLGAEHEDTLKCVNNLAMMYFESGNLSDAEPLFKRVMNVLERFNPKDPKLSGAYQHLASIYVHQSREQELKQIQERMSTHLQ